MARTPQKRTLETRARLVAVAQDIVARNGFEALRVEDVVQVAGVAKGTFFAHFRDKDALMDRLIGARLDAEIDAMVAAPPPRDLAQMVDRLVPLLTFMTSERYVFDVILRYSGAAAREEIGAIATTFGRQIEVFIGWIEGGDFRRDVPAAILAEGVQAFAVQVMALRFCALHGGNGLRDPLSTYLAAWLSPPQPSA
ncbi:TetR/AcrR family transcriptional regulator [Jannaschia pohangensis]|uniref:Transcriptional regulator, TetR family n=1 Tax=Jannaschia pohangensis TaxID=390807 RepID=A0A1I3I3U2_9RHOB|nr:TetR/AcrR family transcriptional regulator [Jannaschia pohangensis]SFI42655.1 transcriptional regulator, TetR family [Jannaschia pohangensis]